MRTTFGRKPIAKDDAFAVRATANYVELQLPRGVDRRQTLYWIPRDRKSAFVAACWDGTIDGVVEQVTPDNLQTMIRRWPTLLGLIVQGIHNRYRHGALVVLEDPDDGRQKWFLVTVVRNLSPYRLDSIVSEQGRRAIDLVHRAATDLLREVRRAKLRPKPSGNRLDRGYLANAIRLAVVESG